MADLDRPLAPRGRKAARRMARHLAARRGGVPALILCSPARRTVATLEPLRPALPAGAQMRVESGLYLASGPRLLARLRRLPDAQRQVLLVGHDPGLHELALALVRPGRSKAYQRLREKLPTGALVVLELRLRHWKELAAGAARLAEFTRPRDLE